MSKSCWSKFRQSPFGERIRSLIPDPVVNLLEHFTIAVLANIFYKFPSKELRVIGVTGTDGKTTTIHLIYQILKTAGLKVDLISTVASSGLHTTTPNSFTLQKILREMVNRRVKYVVLESSSHGLHQHRLWGVKYEVAVVTNITHDHLDYHKTYANYLAAKAKLFRNVRIAILNRDDESFENLKLKIKNSCLAGRQAKIVTYGIKKPADFTPKTFLFKTKLPGEYNQYNCLAAITTASSLGIPEERIRKAILSFKDVPGRMEEIKEGQNFRIVVDFAKTAPGLENALKTLRKQLEGRGSLIVVFGSAGLRDVLKRSMMGEVAGKLADMAILTAEDPRTEDVNKIIEQIAQGCQRAGGIEGATFFRLPDRREAIKFALKMAKKGDVVVLCGKGHERSMCFGTTEYPWNEQEEARKAIKSLLKK